MIILDTNIVSEIIKLHSNQNVLAWFNRQAPQRLAVTAITVAELRYGILILPDGKRREALDAMVSRALDEYFSQSILSFTRQAAEIYATLAAQLRSNGVTVGQNDVMIAAITMEHQAILSTRNDKDFRQCHIEVVNPFEVVG